MPSIGIMSMQRIYNYGSSLQAYGLKRLIEGVTEDARVSFVDYRPGEILVTEGVKAEPTSRLRRAVSKVLEYNEVDAPLRQKLKFFDHKRSYGRRYFPELGIPLEPNRDLALDVQVIGSDEVFNCVQSNTNVGYSRDLFGHGSPARQVMSYAGSFGNTTLRKIEDFGVRADLEADFADFAAISVRDRNSAQIIEALTGRTPSVNVDPALAYDYMRLEPRIPTARQHDGKYLIVYGYSGRLDHDENEHLAAYAKAHGMKILTFGGLQECGDEFVECSPFELLAYFRDAEAVVTDTFHGTIFSIINRRPFATIIRQSSGHGYGNEEKLGYLLEIFGLSDQRVGGQTKITDILAQEIDFDAVQTKLDLERSRTAEYLTSTILEGQQR